MADSTNPNANNSFGSNFLPRIFRSDSNKKFLQATIDQLIQPGTVKKVNGYIGRQNSKATTGDDIFLKASNTARQNYQLEPGLVVKDSLGNTTFFKDYQDYINQLDIFGGNVENHARLNTQEFYSWDPHICWDKFVNFQNYYWLPFGPDVIKVAGQQEEIVSTYNVIVESEYDNNTYIFSPDGSLGLVRNPTIKLFKGQTYRFNINSPGNPFSIKALRTPGSQDRYIDPGLSASGVEQGTITFTVPYSAPDFLFYVSETDIDLGGVFEILSIDENSFIDVETEILGKPTYTLPDGTSLSNGMKVSFIGKVTPAVYATSQYYVEGVGTAIKLVDERILDLVSQYTETQSVQFDSVPFDSMPFSDATSFAGSVDYIVINRSSRDHNPWSRYNRWFHRDVIEKSANYNNKIADLDQTSRAVRPIIEFEADLKLFNFGTTAIADVDLVDTYTNDVFSIVEGQLGYNIDNVDLAQGQRVLFTADTDRLVKNNIYRVEFLTLNGVRQLHLVHENTPTIGDVVLVKQGTKNKGQMYWYNGSTWLVGQQKTELNQSPLFDVVDNDSISYSDTSVYDGSTFSGTKIFSYKVGTGTADTSLGFPLSYMNINNIGDIVFNFNLINDSFFYKSIEQIVTKNINVGYLVKTTGAGTTFVNGWQTSKVTTYQPAIRIYKNSNQVNNFNVDIFDDPYDLDDLTVRVYINGIRVESSEWELIDNITVKTVVLKTDIQLTDVLTIKAFAKQPINSLGYYEIPINLQNNPLNSLIQEFTLGEVIDHVNSIVDNVSGFSGAFPGIGNIRDLGNVTPYGTKFVQHSGPASLSVYHVTSDDNNIVRAIEYARDEYNKFKRNFVSVADVLGVDTDIPTQVDLILERINKDKPTNAPYYFSDMVPYGAKIKTDFTVLDSRIKTYPLTNVFSLDVLSTNAVNVYLNTEQLIYGKDYTFNSQGFVVISATINEDDLISIYEYENTNGSFVPQTPTKLGIWPKYEPKLYLDTTVNIPNGRLMIQGHDGSQILAYGDYRDDLILELEKRIYNNIKVVYDPSIFDIHDIVPGYNRSTDYSLDEFNSILATSFYKWTSLVDRDFTKQLSYDRSNPMTFNYRGHTAPDGRETPGFWRGVYRWLLDTDRPNICPWEMLGLSEMPSWWETTYGPAPYTSDNLPLWQDLSDGILRTPNAPPVILEKYKRPYLINHIPVDSQGNIISPSLSGLSAGVITTSTAGDFVFGDVSPIEATWRRGSFYPFSVLIAAVLMNPAKTIGLLVDRSRISRNKAGQLVYSPTELCITPADVVLPNIYSSTSASQTAGIINYIVDYIVSDNLKSYLSYVYDLQNISARITHRIGSFTSKEKFNLLLDSKTPLSQGSVFVPKEDYDIVLNSSSPIKKLTYSAVIVTKLPDGYEVKGYSKTQPFFKYYAWTNAGVPVNVGGISESYSVWTSGVSYAAGKIVLVGKKYYRVKSLHVTGKTFDSQYYQGLDELPILGGRTANMRRGWDKTLEIVVPYGTKFKSIQEVVDFLLGYGEWLKGQGFIFDEFNPVLNAVTNWETSAKEFLFWTTQNWSTGEDKWDDWLPLTAVSFGSIVRYNGDYYRAIKNSEPSDVFTEDDFVKLDGLSTIGSSVISLSPSAAKLTFLAPLSVADNILNPFYSYEIFKVDGTPLAPNFLNSYREDNAVTYTPIGDDGIFGATFYLVQKEQVVILNNSTIFNDTIYNPASGYRQERIKVAGYVSASWNGSFNVPGFIFDQAIVNDWESWKDYSLGDIVKYKEFYYSANSYVVGEEVFDYTKWIKLSEVPTPKLVPNWTYKATQFTDFYSLDSDNFDVSQQAVAQHLVGYQQRQYLSNIIKDDVSEFKFYQGMIVEKGTQNVLNKLFDVLSVEGKESLTFHEEWALREGQYGATASFDNIEFILDESTFKNNPQGFELVNTINPLTVDFICRQTPNDIYLKPLGYNNNPWPINSKNSFYLRTPGHVRIDEVKTVLASLDEIVNEDVSTFRVGDYVWCGFEGQGWNVYRLSDAHLNVVDVKYSDPELTLISNTNVEIPVGSFVGITQVTGFSGFYKVTYSDLNIVKLSASGLTVPTPFAEQSTIMVFVLTTQKTDSIDNAESVLPLILKDNELLWTGGPHTGDSWATWEYNPVFKKSEIVNYTPTDGFAFGRAVLLNSTGDIALISNATGDIVVYDKASTNSPWLQRQTITAPFISVADGFASPTPPEATGDVLALSVDGIWLATSTPLANNVWIPLIWDNASVYVTGQVVSYAGINYRALSDVPANIEPSNLSSYWSAVYYTPVDVLGADSGLTSQGVVSLYKKDINNIFILVDTIVSPFPASNEKFGSSIVFGDNTMFVSATGNNSNAGCVYQYSFATQVRAISEYNPNGSLGTTLVVTSTVGIKPGMTVSGIGFNNNPTVVEVVNETTILLSAAPTSVPDARLEFFVIEWKYDNQLPITGLTANDGYGSVLSISKDASTLLVSSGSNSAVGKVFVYKNNNGTYQKLTSDFIGNNTLFGRSTSVSDDGRYIAISEVLFDGFKADQGCVKIYSYNGTTYNSEPYQTILPRYPELAGMFGSYISFMNDFKTLAVYSVNGDIYDTLSIDVYSDTYDVFTYDDTNGDTQTSIYVGNPATPLNDSPTTFDFGTTRFGELRVDSGRVDIYDRYDTKWIYSESLTGTGSVTGISEKIAVSSNQVLISTPISEDQSYASGKVFEFRKDNNAYSWDMIHREIPKPAVDKIKRAFLYNRVTNQLVTYLDIVDPSQGKIPGIADQEIKYKTFYDPAVYSTGPSTVNVDDGMAWTTSQVGNLWWDLRTAKFIDSYDEDVVYRNSTWNTLFPGASIDVYEWVETTLLPAEWNAEADTEAGLALGVSGTSLYGDDVYSVVRRYDNVSKTFKNTYYYWVKDKKTIPDVNNRYMPANEVAALISNPRGAEYKHIAITGTNSFSLVNTKNLLKGTEVVLSVEYWTVDNNVQNIHSQWKLISNNVNSEIPSAIEQKWIDSLCGKDEADRIIPDMALPPKLRHGIENRPRQGMFVNRFEALKQLIEQVNRVLIKNQITRRRSISNLELYDVEPSLISGKYDAVVSLVDELRFFTLTPFKRAYITPIITDGRITGVTISEKGQGYVTDSYITVTGNGTGAVLKTKINAKGQISAVDIISSGVGYTSETTVLTVRSYCVLVQSDTAANGRWSIYSYESSTRVWSRVESQAYDTRQYWRYEDWYALGYNQFTPIDYVVSTIADLMILSADIGQTVKILNTGSGNWLLVEKYASSSSVDWTQSYKVIGDQHGTIQFNSSLYQFVGTEFGYDGSLYDGSMFDNSASTELRNILITIRDNILIDDLKTNYLDLFFTSIRYVLSEQNYVDWVFKTSFVKAQHNVGELAQKVTYNNDNLADFESYVSEVKPYRTKIREYVSSYSKIDNSQTSVSDFDLPPVYENEKLSPVDVTVENETIFSSTNQIIAYPWKNWLDNVGFSIIELRIFDGGSGYTSEPVVRFVSDSGSGATARAFISNGSVNRIILTAPGNGYLKAPAVVIDGGLSATGTAAKVFAVIGNSVVRSNLIKMKYDRVSQTYFITQLQETEQLTGSGSRLQFALTWAPDIRIGKSTVIINGVEALRETYKLSIVKSTSAGYTTYSGSIIFDTAPAKNSVITVTYLKDWNLLNAADRIQYYYNPTTGSLGKDLSQLMTGIDYGGVVVSGIGFDTGAGWNSMPYYSDKWDSVDSTFDDYIVTVAAGTHSFTLPYTPLAGTLINVYHTKNKVETTVSDGVSLTYFFDVNDVSPKVTASIETDCIGIVANYVEVGSTGTTIKLSSTDGISEGMQVRAAGYVGQVATVVNLTTITVVNAPSVTLSGELYFTKNIAGSDRLWVTSTTGIKVGDVVTILPYVDKTIGYNTKVVSIINSTEIKLDQILFKDIDANSTALLTRELIVPTDCTIYKNGSVVLTSPLSAGTQVTISSLQSPVRIDDPEFGTPSQSNVNAILATWVANGTSSTISIPLDYDVVDGDQFILRKSTSDGSVAPQGVDYDTALSGGTFTGDYSTGAFTSALGIAADDILVDGDGFVTPMSSSAPEEVVPGQVVDAVAIKVYDRPSSGSANVQVDNFIGDGITTEYVISQQLNSPRAVLVKVTNGVGQTDSTGPGTETIIKNIDIDYVVDYKTNKIIFSTPPAEDEFVSIFSFGFNGSGILDLDYFVSDGVVTEYITSAKWLDSVNSLIYVDGEQISSQSVELFKTDESYESANRIGIRFSEPLSAGKLINYLIVSGSDQTFSIMNTERIPATGTDTYNLSFNIGDSLPTESSMLVRVNQSFLKGPNNSYFTIKSNRLNYAIDPTKIEPYSVSIEDILVFVDGVILSPGIDYTVDMSGIIIKISKKVYKNNTGKRLLVSVKNDQGYLYVPPGAGHGPQIKLSHSYDAPDVIEVISSYKHDILETERSIVSVTSTVDLEPDSVEYYTYTAISGGRIVLDRKVLSDAYIWVLKNDVLLTPSVDYKLNDDKSSIQLERTPGADDKFSLITYSSNVLTSGIAYMQFKDMLNRTHFKRLSLKKSTRLAKDLYFNDLTIEVDDASNFDIPNSANNRPGIIEIHGERIEYFSLNGNVLGQLRRGTLGTGTSQKYTAGTRVQDIGPSETIPYTDTTIVKQIVSDGTNIVNLDFTPEQTTTDRWFTDFGYTFAGAFNNATTYSVNNVVSYDNLYYKCIKTVTASSSSINTSMTPTNRTYWTVYSTIPVGYGQCDNVEVFVGGYDLTTEWATKTAYVVGTIVTIGSYTYKCIESHTSSTFKNDMSKWKFFVGNIRLKKTPYKMHDVNINPYSPAGDVQIDADFAVDGESNQIRLTNNLQFGTHITVIKRQGQAWDNTTNILYDDSKIARFLKATPGITYTGSGKLL